MEVPTLDRRRTTYVVAGVTVLALVVRFAALGTRVFHWDEARVGYWILQYVETGAWSYRPIVHGPFLFHVNDLVFRVAGTTDFSARAVVALVGGLLPLSALLFRERLRPIETVIVSGFLAVNPVLLYYSRFMRNDVLVAGFSLVALGFFLRLVETGRQRYLYAGSASLALAATTKEIFVVYVAVWVLGVVLLFDNRLVTARLRDEDWRTVVSEHWAALRAHVDSWALPIWAATVEFLLIVAFFYAPRPDLYRALGTPSELPGVLEAGTVGAWKKLWGTWVDSGHEHSYIDFLVADVERLVATALVLVLFAVLGFLIDRYGRRGPRDVVTIGFVWGAAIFLAYPAITDISAPWGIVHTVVPLAIPAAVGIAYVLERGVRLARGGNRIGAGIVAALFVLAALQVGGTAYDTSFDSSQAPSNPLVQYGQPAGHLQETLSDVERIAETNDGPDVLFYGEHFYVADEDAPLEGPNWTNRFPLTWYLERSDAELRSTKRPEGLEDPPPVVIARASDYPTVNEELSGYEALAFELTSPNTETVFFIDRSALESPSE